MTEQFADFPAARGNGSELFTDRVIFYLKHRRQIDEWTSLRQEAIQACSSILRLITEPFPVFPGLVRWQGPVEKHSLVLDSPWSGIGSWPPKASLGIGWWTNTVVPDKKGSAPWVGIRANPDDPIYPDLNKDLEEFDGGGKPEYQSTRWWPRWKECLELPDWWTDLDGYASRLLLAMESLQETYGPFLALQRSQPDP